MKLKDLKWICERKQNVIFRFGVMFLLVFSIYFFSATSSLAAPGELDLTFGIGGKVITQVGLSGRIESIALQADGKIIAAGRAFFNQETFEDFAVARYNTNGSLDPTFGVGGVAATPVTNDYDRGNSVALQADGKIVVAGSTWGGPLGLNIAIVRYNSDGSLDTTFDGDGIVITAIGERDGGTSVAIQSDGKIVVAGSGNYNIA